MNIKDIQTLEFGEFKEFINSKITSSFASQRLQKLHILNQIDKINDQQNLIRESILLVVRKEYEIPEDNLYSEFLLKLDDHMSAYEPSDFLCFMNFHKALAKLKKELLDTGDIEYLKIYLSEISSFRDLVVEVDCKISPDGRIKDTASVLLGQIRKEINQHYFKINKSLSDILNKNNSDKFIQERIVTSRNNRFTLMCKSNFKQYLNGIVHDMSDSGQTFYVEPAALVESNNRYQKLKIEEANEIINIIKLLIQKILDEKESIFNTVQAYGIVAFNLELAVFYKRYIHCFPEISDNVKFVDIHHPLILFHKEDESVALDIQIPSDKKVVVITGPNTGGKTAALKSIGLNIMIAKCGLPLFGKEAQFVMYDNIFADIGDQQSILMDLSTFSSHMLNIKRVIDTVTENSLVLFDELGTGTEPKEGAFLAVAILEYLLEKNVTAVITTHFAEVKLFARNCSKALVYSVDFNYETFLPSYRLLQGVEGKSDPLLIARKLHFHPDVLSKAEKHIEFNTSQMDISWEEINNLKLSLVSKIDEVDTKIKEITEKERIIVLKEEKLNIMLGKREIDLLEETYSLLHKAKSSLKKKPSRLDKSDIEHDLRATAGKLDKLKQKRETIKDIKVGDIIFLEKHKKQAKIIRFERNKVFIDMEGLKVSIDKRELVGRKVTEIKKDKKIIVSDKVTRNRKSEIVIIGKNVEEAEDILDQYIDEQILAGVDIVAIVHGRGSGALKKGVHNFLRKDQRVVSFRLAEFNEGGQAITIIKI